MIFTEWFFFSLLQQYFFDSSPFLVPLFSLPWLSLTTNHIYRVINVSLKDCWFYLIWNIIFFFFLENRNYDVFSWKIFINPRLDYWITLVVSFIQLLLGQLTSLCDILCVSPLMVALLTSRKMTNLFETISYIAWYCFLQVFFHLFHLIING